jgi:hypothetical protein
MSISCLNTLIFFGILHFQTHTDAVDEWIPEFTILIFFISYLIGKMVLGQFDEAIMATL